MMQDQDQRREQTGDRPEEPAVVPSGRAAEQPAGAGIGALAGGDGPPPKPEPRTVRGFRVISYGDTPANRATAAEFKEHLHTHGIADVELVQDKTTLCVFVPAAGDSKADLEALRKRLQSVPPPRFDSKFRFDDLLPGRLTRN
jgi:hypothetical protein